MSDKYLGEDQPARRTTPTWELELLISGATVFALMQLPEPLNRALIILINGNEQSIGIMMRAVSIYLQFSLIVLILTFVLHLLARAYWVALVGMYSVYPQGIRWENKNATGGPAWREFGKNQMGSMPDQIDQADNRATQIFGMGFGMALPMMGASLMVGLMVMIMLVVQMLNGDMEKWSAGLWAAFGGLFLVFFIAYLADYQFGEVLKAKGRDGWIKKIYAAYQKIGMGNGSNPLIALYSSNEGTQKVTIGMAIIMLPLMVGISLFTNTRGVSIDNGAYDGLPKAQLGAELVLRPEYYESSRREELSTTLVPYIEDYIVESGYLRLFIPYQPSRYNSFLQKQCPESLIRRAADSGEGLNCLSKFFAIQVDAQVVTQPLLAAVDPQTGQRGANAMIDIRKLSDGQHVLKIRAVPNASESDKNEESKFHVIPFWK